MKNSPVYKVLRSLLTVCGIVIISLLLLEGILRLFGIKAEISEEWMFWTIDQGERELDDDVILTMTSFNSDAHYLTSEGNCVIVALGDSFTQSFPALDEDTYPRQLEKYLKERGEAVDVINLGMGPWGSEQQLTAFKTKCLPRLKPDIVVWQWCQNDFWDNMIWSLYHIDDNSNLVPHGVRYNWVYYRQKIFDAIPGSTNMKLNIYSIRLLMKAAERLQRHYLPAGYKTYNEAYGYQKAMLTVDEMRSLARIHGFKLVITLVDLQLRHLPDDGIPFSDAEWAWPQYEQMSGSLSGFPEYFDTSFQHDDLAVMRSHFPEADLDSIAYGLFATEEQDSMVLGTRHYNKYGYWLFARKVGEHLLENFF